MLIFYYIALLRHDAPLKEIGPSLPGVVSALRLGSAAPLPRDGRFHDVSRSALFHVGPQISVLAPHFGVTFYVHSTIPDNTPTYTWGPPVRLLIVGLSFPSAYICATN